MSECIHELDPAQCSICRDKSTFRTVRSTPLFARSSPTPIPATFSSKCAACGDRIREGDMIVKLGDWIHEECAI